MIQTYTGDTVLVLVMVVVEVEYERKQYRLTVHVSSGRAAPKLLDRNCLLLVAMLPSVL